MAKDIFQKEAMLYLSATLEASSLAIQGVYILEKRLENQVGEEKGKDGGRIFRHGTGEWEGVRIE